MSRLLSSSKRIIVFVGFNLLAIAAILIFLEGLASFVIFFRSVSSQPIAERSHTRYDPELGWVNRPQLFLEDMYGPGLDLTINAQGFRSQADISPAAPDDQLRLICSGDSFTLGYGVSNEQTWCHLFETLDRRLQSVNMGQGGYGVDQAYLWYKRDGLKLEHDLHLFTFITTDFDRMQQASFLGYGKPLLTLEEGTLRVNNVPVPERAFYVPWLTQNSESIRQLKLVQLAAGLDQPTAQAAEANGEAAERNLGWGRVAARMLEDLETLNEQRGSLLVLVYLPTLADHAQPLPAQTAYWREQVFRAAQAQQIIFIDLLTEFRALPVDQVQPLFLSQTEVSYPGAAGHYSVAGNRYIADRIYQGLLAQPPVVEKLDQLGR